MLSLQLVLHVEYEGSDIGKNSCTYINPPENQKISARFIKTEEKKSVVTNEIL